MKASAWPVFSEEPADLEWQQIGSDGKLWEAHMGNKMTSIEPGKSGYLISLSWGYRNVQCSVKGPIKDAQLVAAHMAIGQQTWR